MRIFYTKIWTSIMFQPKQRPINFIRDFFIVYIQVIIFCNFYNNIISIYNYTLS